MGLLDLSPYKVVNDVSNVDGTVENNQLDAIQAVVNALIDANIASNAAIAIPKIADPMTGKVIGSSGGSAAAVFPPGYEFGYDQTTAAATVSSATEATGTTVISCGAHAFDGSPVIAEFFAPTVAVGDFVIVSLFEGATQIGRLADLRGSAGQQYAAAGKLRFTPTAASHTYTVTAFRNAVNGTVQAGAGGTATYVPAWIRFTKV